MHGPFEGKGSGKFPHVELSFGASIAFLRHSDETLQLKMMPFLSVSNSFLLSPTFSTNTEELDAMVKKLHNLLCDPI